MQQPTACASCGKALTAKDIEAYEVWCEACASKEYREIQGDCIMTNFERITGSVEALAETLHIAGFCAYPCSPCPDIEPFSCAGCITYWLNQPAEGGGD